MTPRRFAHLQTILGTRQPDLTVLTDGVHKSHNVSAILRTCDAVGVRRLHAVAAAGEMDRHHMVAGGSRRWVDVVLHDSTTTACQALKQEGFRLFVAHACAGALDYRDCDFTGKTALILGAELTGPSASAIDEADAAVAIPMHGMVESLNVSVAAALLLYEAERQKAAAGHYAQRKVDEPEYSKTLFEWAHPNIAKRCRQQNLPYPPMTEDGDLAANPFVERAVSGKSRPGSSRDRSADEAS